MTDITVARQICVKLKQPIFSVETYVDGIELATPDLELFCPLRARQEQLIQARHGTIV